MLRPIGTQFKQIEQHDGGTLEIAYGVVAYVRLQEAIDVRGTLGNVELVTQEPTVEILEVLSVKLLSGSNQAAGFGTTTSSA